MPPPRRTAAPVAADDPLVMAPSPATVSRPANSEGVARLVKRPPARKQIFTGLDIGTTKVCAIIGEINTDGRVSILGLASTPSHGLRRGIVINLDETVDSICSAIRKAEEIAQVTVRDVFVGIAGGHIECLQLKSEIDVASPERGISRADIARVVRTAVESHIAVDREVLHQIPTRFMIDDGPILDPLGFHSRRLGVELMLVTAAVTSAQNIIRAVTRSHCRVAGIYLEPLASSLAVISEEEKELGVVLIDIGGGTSDVAVWAGGAVRYTGVLPVGGDAITEDVAKGLEISRYDAENLKKKFGHCLPEAVDEAETIESRDPLTGQMRQHSRRFLAEIIEARVEEMFELIRNRLKTLPCYGEVYGGVILTGGTSLQKGMTEVATRVFGKRCKLGAPAGLGGLAGAANSPIYSTGVGLVLYGLEHEREQSYFDGNNFQRIWRSLGGLIDWYS